jgi:hypothetical protein
MLVPDEVFSNFPHAPGVSWAEIVAVERGDGSWLIGEHPEAVVLAIIEAIRSREAVPVRVPGDRVGPEGVNLGEKDVGDLGVIVVFEADDENPLSARPPFSFREFGDPRYSTADGLHDHRSPELDGSV